MWLFKKKIYENYGMGSKLKIYKYGRRFLLKMHYKLKYYSQEIIIMDEYNVGACGIFACE